MELDFTARALLGRVDRASVEWARIDMQADSAMVELAGIHNAMHGIGRVNRAWMRNVHLDGIERSKPAGSAREILMNQMKILHLQAPQRNRHPAVLVPMIVHRTGLANFPADRHQLVKRSAIDQVAGVMLAIPVKVRGERVLIYRRILQKTPNRLSGNEGGRGYLSQFPYQVLN